MLNRLIPAILVLSCVGCSDSPALPTIRVTEEVLLNNPSRLGVNLGASAYWGDQQMVSNPFAHGAFHKGRQTLLIQVKDATETTVTDSYFEPGDPNRSLGQSFKGGRYCIATGQRAGERGAITAHEPGSPTFTLEHSGSPLQDKDVVWLRGPASARALPDPEHGETPLGIGDFRALADEEVQLDFVADPESKENQRLRISFPATKQRLRGGLKHYIKATPITNYAIKIRARADFAGAELGVGMKNHGIPHDEEGNTVPFFAKNGKKLTEEWKEYTFQGGTYADPRIAEHFSAFSVVVNATNTGAAEGHAYIDWVRLEDDMLAHPTGFAKAIVDTLKEARCGVLRFYGISGLGNLIEDLLAPTSTESSWTYLSLESGFRFNTTHATAKQWLELCNETGAKPWLTIGGSNTPQDWEQLISYLAAPAGFDEATKRRVDQGRTDPWINDFETIYLEIGNEWWNSIFRPFHIWPPEKYGELCTTILKSARKHPHFNAEKITFIVGGWAINAHHWNGLLDATAQGHDRLSIAPYLVHELNRSNSTTDRYASLFADVDAYVQHGGASTLKDFKQNQSETGLAVYELNTHITGGAAPAKTVSEICTSTAAGVAVLDQAMSLMANLQANPINYFTLLQRGYGQGDQRRLGLWGALIRLPEGDLQPRPVWQGLRLANQYAIAGNLVKSTAQEMPTWNHRENGSVPELSGLPVLHSYAFATKNEAQKRQINLLVINRNLETGQSLKVDLPFTPQTGVAVITLASQFPKDNNEDFEKVSLKEEKISNYSPGDALATPPCAAVVFQFTER